MNDFHKTGCDMVSDFWVLIRLLGDEQESIDSILSGVKGTWWFDCDCDCETAHMRTAILLISRHVFGRILFDGCFSGVLHANVSYMYSLIYLMVESGVYSHYDTFHEQDEHAPFYANNWLLLGFLAQQVIMMVEYSYKFDVSSDIFRLIERFGCRR